MPLLAGSALIALAAPAHAQLSPGPNPITGTTAAQTLTGGTGTIDPGGKISTSGSGAALAISGTATLTNNGTIENTGSGRAIDSNSGSATLFVTNNGTISAVSTDAFRINTAGTSITMDNTGTIQVTNGGQAIDWANILTGTNKLTNAGTITAVGEDAIRPGQNGEVINTGTGIIKATPTVSAGVATGSDGIDLRTQKTVTVTNSGTIEGRHGIATDGANVGPSKVTVDNKAGGTITAVNGSGLNIDGVNTSVTATVTNAFGATIQGGVLATTISGDGDGIDVDGVLTLTNSGNVLGRGAKGTGSDGGNNNAEGVAAGGGTIVNTATGRIIGAATAPNADTTRVGTGILMDDSTGGSAIAATKIDNAGLIQGEKGAAVKIVGTFADSVTNSGNLTTTGATAVDLGAGNDTMTISGTTASVTGDMDGAADIDTLIFDLTVVGTFAYGDEILNFENIFVLSGTVTLTNVYVGADTFVNGGTLRFVGDQSSNLDFLNLVGDARVNGHTAGYTYDGTYTTLSQVPEPATLALFGTGLLGLAALRRRTGRLAARS